ncbi:MAG: peptidylprolyl isomerase [Coriobacteriia bacterium]
MHPRTSRAIALVMMLALTVFVVGVSGCGASTRTSDQIDANTTEPSGESTSTAAVTPEEDSMHVSDVKITGNEIAVITTKKGVIKLKFYPEVAPNHVGSFIELASQGFYDGTTFHRVEPGFVVQGGDPYSKSGAGPVGTGGPGYQLAAEFNDKPHLEGTLAMARSQNPDSAGSQFYICLAPAPFLDGQYTVFGQVTEGMDIVKQIAVGDVMESVRIEQGE